MTACVTGAGGNGRTVLHDVMGTFTTIRLVPVEMFFNMQPLTK